tara:strand:+ start:2809 stop:3594 length:786 start_codon:yes stop_codon:yes gene_type:complete
MAWADVSGSNNTLEYENAATAANTYADAPGTYSGGIRTYTTPGTGLVNKIYARTRLKGEINLISYSEAFDNGWWTKTRQTVVANAGVAPDGTTTADNSIPNSGALSNVLLYRSITSVSRAASIYAKSNGYDYISIIFQAGAGDSMGVQFKLSDGTIAASQNATGTIVDVGNGWYRCSIIPTTSTSSGYLIYQVSDGTTPNTSSYFNTAFTGDGSKGVLVWGAMLNEGPNLRRYIKTVAGASTTIERGELSKDFYDATHVGF